VGWLPPEVTERVVPKFDWIRLLERVPPTSALYAHDRCGTLCERRDKKHGPVSRLRASTIAHVGVTLALKANIDGTEAWYGVDQLAAATKRNRVTVITALRHLETVGLLHLAERAGTMGLPRTWANKYVLTRPCEQEMAAAGLGEESARYDWFLRRGTTSG
jgi:hypothetical protein